MERVEGIGGFFFIAADPEGLSRWYADQLGVTAPPLAYDAEVWTQQAGPTVFAPFSAEGAEASPVGSNGWGLNFRVRDLDAMVSQLRANGIDVEVDTELYPIGRFAQLRDPEGNSVQLWEPQPAT
jgi:predicted enzyme related to lactoylglutathione lyase